MGQPNIILLLSDDQGWNGLSVPMDPGDPDSREAAIVQNTSISRNLRGKGMTICPNAYAPAPVCSPSRASIQTGQQPRPACAGRKAARPFTAADGFRPDTSMPPNESLETGETDHRGDR